MLLTNVTDIRHPVVAGTRCPVLQYADDTLLLVKRELSDIQATVTSSHRQPGSRSTTHTHTKALQYLFTWLRTLSQIVLLRLSAFAPQIAKCDKYLGGWETALLKQVDRATLIDSVLDSSQVVYAMGALAIPPERID